MDFSGHSFSVSSLNYWCIPVGRARTPIAVQPDRWPKGTVRKEWGYSLSLSFTQRPVCPIYAWIKKRMWCTAPVGHFMTTFTCPLLHPPRSLWQFSGGRKYCLEPTAFSYFYDVLRRYGRTTGLLLAFRHFLLWIPLPKTPKRGRGEKCVEPKQRPLILPYLLGTSQNLKKVGACCGFQVVFSAPRKSPAMCLCSNCQSDLRECRKIHIKAAMKCCTGLVYRILFLWAVYMWCKQVVA